MDGGERGREGVLRKGGQKGRKRRGERSCSSAGAPTVGKILFRSYIYINKNLFRSNKLTSVGMGGMGMANG